MCSYLTPFLTFPFELLEWWARARWRRRWLYACLVRFGAVIRAARHVLLRVAVRCRLRNIEDVHTPYTTKRQNKTEDGIDYRMCTVDGDGDVD